MAETPDDPAADAHEEVGSVGEEAAKLFSVLSGWARDAGVSSSEAAADAGQGLADAVRGIDQHIATGGEDCRYCPLCRVIHAARDTSPEVKAHLASAAGSLMQAAAGVLATRAPRAEPPVGVERIDLDVTDDDARSEDPGSPS
jgi:hypothetical protein